MSTTAAESEEIYKIVVEEASILAALYTGPEIRIRVVNNLMLKAWGKDRTIIGKTIREANPEWEGQPFFDYFDQVYKTGIEHVSVEERADLPTDAGLRPFYYNFNYKPLKREDGSVWGIVHTALDVTEQVMAKKAREESEINFSNMIRLSPVATCIFSGQGFVLTVVNRKMLDLMAKTEEKALNRPILEVLPEIQNEGYEEILNNVYKTGIPFEAKEMPVPLLRKGKLEMIYVNFSYTPMRNGEGEITDIMGVAIDVSDQVLSRKRIEESEQRLKLAVDNAEAGVYDINLTTGLTVRSLRHAQIFGYTDTTEPWTIGSLLGHIFPEDVDFAKRYYEVSLKQGTIDVNFRIRRKDGEVRWIHVIGKVHYNERNEPVRILGTTSDVTDKKVLERQKDEFVSTVSHELKTPLTSIKAYLQLLQRPLTGSKNDRSLGFLKRLERQVSRLENLIKGLLDVTRIDVGKLKLKEVNFDMQSLVTEVISDLQAVYCTHELVITQNHSIKLQADPDRIVQVITNLITNAVKYSPHANRVLISSTFDNQEAVFKVEDFGIGIAEDQRSYIFNRFHQAGNNNDQLGLSLGLGLYISKEIIEKANGRIWYKSEEGKGTNFYFSLPCCKE